ncbi:MAG: oligosaccharide flippase family protein [Anaerolineales bacterium]|nr:oligosaccharide flippase family protein [Anaerolineales bacterium]
MVARLKVLLARVLENPLIRRILRNSAYLFSATGVSAGMSFFQSILAGRLLGPATFGILGAVTTFTSVANRFASFRIDELVVRYVSHYQQQGETRKAAAVFKLAGSLEILGSLLAFGLIWWLAPLGAEYFARDLTLVSWFRVYGAIVLVNLIYESAIGLLQVFDRFRVIAVVMAVQSAVTLLLIGVAFVLQGDLYWIVGAYMSGKVVASLAITAAALQQARRAWGLGWWRTPIAVLRGERRSLLTFAFSTNLSSTISLIAKDSEVLWVSAFLGPAQAGYYKTALALTNLLQLPVSPLPKATFPELAREIAGRSWDNVRYVLRQGSRLAAAYSVPMAIGLVLAGRWLIGLTYGPEFLPAYGALVILLVGYTFTNIFYWNRVALLSLARPVFPTIVNFVGMVLKVSGIFLLVPHLGYLAFAGLLSGYYIFTVGIAAGRVRMDLRARDAKV